MLTRNDVRSVSPALDRYTQDLLLNGVWKRPGLSPRDRSLVTVAVLVARQQTIEMPYHINFALDNGVTPGELSEVITHLAFYAGWANAMSAVNVAKDVFDRRGIDVNQLPTASPELLPIDLAAESTRAASVQENMGPVSQGLVDDTGNLLFKELWLRPGLAPRDLGRRRLRDALIDDRTHSKSRGGGEGFANGEIPATSPSSKVKMNPHRSR